LNIPPPAAALVLPHSLVAELDQVQLPELFQAPWFP